MPVYVGQDNWDTEIVMPDENTPVLGGTPEWSGRQMVSGFSNIPSAQLANRTVYLFNRVNEIVNAPVVPDDDPNALKKIANLSDLDNAALARYNLGLGNVDNTSDADKPVQQFVIDELDKKVNKVAGKGLSTNDFTNAYKSRIDNLPDDFSQDLPQVLMDGDTVAEVNKLYIFNADSITLTLPTTGMVNDDKISFRTAVEDKYTQIIDFGTVKFRGVLAGQVYLDIPCFGLDIVFNEDLGEWV